MLAVCCFVLRLVAEETLLYGTAIVSSTVTINFDNFLANLPINSDFFIFKSAADKSDPQIGAVIFKSYQKIREQETCFIQNLCSNE